MQGCKDAKAFADNSHTKEARKFIRKLEKITE